MDSQHNIIAHCQTDRGMIRSKNEDTCFVSLEKNYFLIADGIGGSAAGEVASRLFMDTAKEVFEKDQPTSLEEAEKVVKVCFHKANLKIQQHVTLHPQHKGMGCTAELLVLMGKQFIVGHVGDSRTYCYKNGVIEVLTEDHSLAQEQVKRGLLSQDEATKSRTRNILLRAVGADKSMGIDIIRGEVEPGSIYLLCSDGLYNMVPESQILPVLLYDAPLSLKTEMLINMANAAGGEDNISVVLIEISE